MATYKEIQIYVKNKHGFTPKTCWIAHVKEICGLTKRRLEERRYPCPPERIENIKDAFKHFKMT
jgi:hypothetical protein